MEFCIRAQGKPALLKPFAPLEFNLSHSGDCVLIAVTAGVHCGVDIERRRPIFKEQKLAEGLFSHREIEWLSRTENGFHRLWTMKEAIIKAIGHGLSIELSHIDLTDVLERKTPSILIRIPGMEPQLLWLKELHLLPNYAAAVATVGSQRIFRLVSGEVESQTV